MGNFYCNVTLILLFLKNGIPPFYLNCLKTWFSLQPPITSYEADIICNEIVWNNKCILIDKNTIYSQSLKQKGLVKVIDLLSSQGGFAKTNELLSRRFTHAEAFSIMSYQDVIPFEWRKKLKRKHLSITHTPNQKDKLLINDDLTLFTGRYKSMTISI